MTKGPPPPSHLEATTALWWQSVVTKWALDAHHIKLLTLASEAWDRCQQARVLLEKDGMLTANGSRAHPCIRIELDSRISFSRLLRELDLDIEHPAAASRPPSLRSVVR